MAWHERVLAAAKYEYSVHFHPLALTRLTGPKAVKVSSSRSRRSFSLKVCGMSLPTASFLASERRAGEAPGGESISLHFASSALTSGLVESRNSAEQSGRLLNRIKATTQRIRSRSLSNCCFFCSAIPSSFPSARSRNFVVSTRASFMELVLRSVRLEYHNVTRLSKLFAATAIEPIATHSSVVIWPDHGSGSASRRPDA